MVEFFSVEKICWILLLEFFSVEKIHFLQKNTIPGEKAAVLRSEIPEKKPSVSSAEKRRKTAIFQGFFDKNAVFRRKFENFFESGKTGGGVFENASLIFIQQDYTKRLMNTE